MPHVTCLYPGTQGDLAEKLYELAQVWSYGGEWVHAFLYKKFGYLLVAPPETCGYCNTRCSIQVNPAAPNNGDVVTITVTVTNIDGSPTKGDAPEGTVAIYVDGALLCTQELPEQEPDVSNYQTATCQWTADCTNNGNHTIEAVYTPSVADFANTSCSASVTVGNCGVLMPCCANDLPDTVHLTISGSGTYAIPYLGNNCWGGQIGWTCPGGSLGYTVVDICCQGLPGNYGFAISVTGDWNWGSGSAGATSTSCDPFQLTFESPDASCGGNQTSITITVTE